MGEEFEFDHYAMDWGAQGWGFVDRGDDWINKLDVSNNLPYWYGPWAGGLSVNVTQDAGALDLRSLNWENSGDIVVHAMADAEWGGCQFRVANAAVEKHDDQAILEFQLRRRHGWWRFGRG